MLRDGKAMSEIRRMSCSWPDVSVVNLVPPVDEGRVCSGQQASLAQVRDGLQSYDSSFLLVNDMPAGRPRRFCQGLLGPMKCTALILCPYRLYAGA
jgi:hypothetical protein